MVPDYQCLSNSKSDLSWPIPLRTGLVWLCSVPDGSGLVSFRTLQEALVDLSVCRSGGTSIPALSRACCS